MAATKTAEAADRGFDIRSGDGGALTLADVDVALPDGAVLLRDVNLTIDRGSSVLFQGPSGSGKTTLFRVLAGIWPFGQGRITLPRGARILFLPQRPYLPLGTLRDALSYPETPQLHEKQAFVDALTACRLPHLTQLLDESGNWTMTLSPGEQQRLAFARALLYRPEWIFLDEASSALDDATEAELYLLFKQRLPGATIISIAHKTSVARFHDRRIIIDPRAGCVEFADIKVAE